MFFFLSHDRTPQLQLKTLRMIKRYLDCPNEEIQGFGGPPFAHLPLPRKETLQLQVPKADAAQVHFRRTELANKGKGTKIRRTNTVSKVLDQTRRQPTKADRIELTRSPQRSRLGELDANFLRRSPISSSPTRRGERTRKRGVVEGLTLYQFSAASNRLVLLPFSFSLKPKPPFCWFAKYYFFFST